MKWVLLFGVLCIMALLISGVIFESAPNPESGVAERSMQATASPTAQELKQACEGALYALQSAMRQPVVSAVAMREIRERVNMQCGAYLRH